MTTGCRFLKSLYAIDVSNIGQLLMRQIVLWAIQPNSCVGHGVAFPRHNVFRTMLWQATDLLLHMYALLPAQMFQCIVCCFNYT